MAETSQINLAWVESYWIGSWSRTQDPKFLNLPNSEQLYQLYYQLPTPKLLPIRGFDCGSPCWNIRFDSEVVIWRGATINQRWMTVSRKMWFHYMIQSFCHSLFYHIIVIYFWYFRFLSSDTILLLSSDAIFDTTDTIFYLLPLIRLNHYCSSFMKYLVVPTVCRQT